MGDLTAGEGLGFSGDGGFKVIVVALMTEEFFDFIVEANGELSEVIFEFFYFESIVGVVPIGGFIGFGYSYFGPEVDDGCSNFEDFIMFFDEVFYLLFIGLIGEET